MLCHEWNAHCKHFRVFSVLTLSVSLLRVLFLIIRNFPLNYSMTCRNFIIYHCRDLGVLGPFAAIAMLFYFWLVLIGIFHCVVTHVVLRHEQNTHNMKLHFQNMCVHNSFGVVAMLFYFWWFSVRISFYVTNFVILIHVQHVYYIK